MIVSTIVETRDDVKWLKVAVQALLDHDGIGIDRSADEDGEDFAGRRVSLAGLYPRRAEGLPRQRADRRKRWSHPFPTSSVPAGAHRVRRALPQTDMVTATATAGPQV